MSNLAASTEDIHRASSSLWSLVRKLLSFISQNPNKPHKILLSTTTLASDQSSSLFLSLPNDIILNCLAFVPRQDYSIISHVSKSLRSFVLSPELRQMRFLKGKDHPILYICFRACNFRDTNLSRYFWFIFDPNEKKTKDLKPIPGLSQKNNHYYSNVSIGSKIYFVGGCGPNISRNLWIYNSWSGELCKGPKMRVGRTLPVVAVVDEKLYVMGGCREENIQIEVFDTKTQSWEVGPLNLHGEIDFRTISNEAVAIEEKIYAMSRSNGSMIIYNTKDGRYETYNMPYNEVTLRDGVCVINNVMYVYYFSHGLMWYDSKDKSWRMVQGLNMHIFELGVRVVIAEVKGKLGLFWKDLRISNKTPIWYAMIVLDRNGEEIHGTIESSVLVGYVPHSYLLWRSLSVSD